MSGTQEIAELAAGALRSWGGGAKPPRLVKWRENVVFDVRLAQGRRIALRLHRPGYQTRASIEAELQWTALLAAAGQPVPAPVPALDGARTVTAGDRIASAVAWLPGSPIGSAEHPLPGTPAERRALMGRLGRLIAEVHAATDSLAAARHLARPAWDRDGLLGERPLWGRFWENPAFSVSERGLIAEARSEAARRLADLAAGGADFGLIHADCLRENVLSDRDGLALIDFDDSGWGFRMYDLATAVVQGLEEPGVGDHAQAVLEGYASVRSVGPSPGGTLTLFLMLRAFASAGWIMGRASGGDPRLGFYADRAVRMARMVLSGRAICG
ncbi:MAG: phosphotransferase enzyme family protein [Pseudomonadota bacterium]